MAERILFLTIGKLKPEEKHTLRRKLTHLTGVLYIFGVWFLTLNYGFYLASILLVSLTMFSMSVYVAYNLLKFLGFKLIHIKKLWWKLGSPEDLNGRKYYWDVCWLGLSLSICTLLSFLVGDVRIAYIMACTVILGDGFAGIIGILFGKHKIFYNQRKTVEGHLSGFTVAFLFSLLITKSFSMSFVGVGVGMLVETLPIKVSDNATVPLSTTLTLIALKTFFGV